MRGPIGRIAVLVSAMAVPGGGRAGVRPAQRREHVHVDEEHAPAGAFGTDRAPRGLAGGHLQLGPRLLGQAPSRAATRASGSSTSPIPRTRSRSLTTSSARQHHPGQPGDVVVWDDILVRSWNSPATATSTCDGQLMGAGFEASTSSTSAIRATRTWSPRCRSTSCRAWLRSRAARRRAYGSQRSAVRSGANHRWAHRHLRAGQRRVGTTTDACEPLVGFPAGAIAVVDRGGCEFGFKALTAQNAGAIGVIVVNNAPGIPIVMGPGAVGGQVTIPAVHVSQADGATIKAGLPVRHHRPEPRAWLRLAHRDQVPTSRTTGCSSTTARQLAGSATSSRSSRFRSTTPKAPA